MIGKWLATIEADLSSVSWSLATEQEGAVFYSGDSKLGRYTVASFSIEEQGFPAGSRGYDGAFAGGGVVLHLTRELAEKAFRLAEKGRT